MRHELCKTSRCSNWAVLCQERRCGLCCALHCKHAVVPIKEEEDRKDRFAHLKEQRAQRSKWVAADPKEHPVIFGKVTLL